MRIPTFLHTTFILLSFSAFSFADGNQHNHTHHHHKNIGKEQPVPTLRLHLYQDAVDGFNLFVDAKNFAFSLPASQADQVTKEKTELPRSSSSVSGHAHLYIGDKKIGRVYGSYVHLPAKYFAKGTHKIRVNLNDDDHVVWAVNDRKVEATITLDLSGDQPKITATSNFALVQNNY